MSLDLKVETKNYKTIAKFGSQKEDWQMGDSIVVRLSKGLKKLKPLPNVMRQSKIGLFQEPLGNKTEAYRTWLITSSIFEGTHDGWVSLYEGDTHPPLWLSHINVEGCGREDYNFGQIRFNILSKIILKALEACTTEDNQLWMASRFTARSYPAAVRWLPDKVLQVWIPL
tara:strand:- start:51 stop:560 length:510 start_codon:yes stop_codon:yes gene_type:complete